MSRTDRPADEHAASRREFFRTFSRQTVHSAGAVIGAATELRRTGSEAARELFGSADARIPSTAAPAAVESPPDTAEWSYRSAYRFTADSIVLLDQRELPEHVTTLVVREATEVASAIREGVVNGGPVVGQVAAYALVLAARAASDRSEAGRQQHFRAAAGTLRGARRDLQTLVTSVDSMEARYDALLDSGAAPDAIAAALGDEADRIASDATVAHASIGRAAAAVLGASGGEQVELLMHGDLGPLSCGMAGIATTLAAALADAGRSIHVWVTEAAPSREGARLAALQLTQHDVPHTLIPDAAVASLLETRHMDAAVLRGDRLAANGDAGTIVGGLGVARLAKAAGVPTYVLAPLSAVDHSAASGAEFESATVASWTTDVVPVALIEQTISEGYAR